MSLLMQISDPHFGTEQPAVVEALVVLVKSVQPGALVLSGDITQRAKRSEFEAARRFCDRLAGPPLLVLPGNHDIPLLNPLARIFAPYRHYQRSFGVQLEPEIETSEFLVIGVNTTRAWRHKDGQVSAEQIDRVSRRLRGARREQLRIVVTHQPLHVPNERDAHNLLHGREAAAQAWAAAGADMVMGGHIHLPFVRPLRDRFAELPRDLWCVQAGTSVSSRIRREAANSVNLLRYDPDQTTPQCTVERWDFQQGDVDRFCLAEMTVIDLDRFNLPLDP
jgi:3',5'-cyclic AMP phosphodiesterase CpdA